MDISTYGGLCALQSRVLSFDQDGTTYSSIASAPSTGTPLDEMGEFGNTLGAILAGAFIAVL